MMTFFFKKNLIYLSKMESRKFKKGKGKTFQNIVRKTKHYKHPFKG